MRALTLSLALGLAALAGCGPIPVDQAERACLDRARLAAGPRGEVGMGVSSTGRTESRIKIEVSSDWMSGRDPSAVFDLCVQDRSGQPPRLPLYMQPGWTG